MYISTLLKRAFVTAFGTGAALSLCFLSAESSHASTLVDFEDVSSPVFSFTSIQSQGFTVQHQGSFAHLEGNTGQGATDFSGNGTNRVISFNTSTITLSESQGNIFDLFNFDGGESWVFQPHSWARQIQVKGFKGNGSTVSQIFDLDLIKSPLNGLQTFTLNNTFTSLTKVEFTGIGGNPEFSIDNIAVSTKSVPEPTAMLGLLSVAVVGVSSVLKRKQQKEA